MKQLRIGLVLGGGGAKGAYQLGALLALSKHRLLEHVRIISATSIGAINLLLLLGGHLEDGIEVWKHLGKGEILPKRKWRDIIKNITNFGLFSRSGLLDMFDSYIDFEAVSKSDTLAYVTATRTGSDTPTHFKLNGATSDEIIKYTLASSAIPLVYEPVLIDGKKYVDGGKLANEPFAPLAGEELDLIILIPLNDRYVIPASFGRTPIIDLGSPIFAKMGSREGLDFNPQKAQERLYQGYRQADELISDLRLRSLIALTTSERLKRWWKRKRGKLEEMEKVYRKS